MTTASGIEGSPALPGLWSSVWKLLRLRWVIFYNGFRRARRSRQVGILFLGVLLLGFLGFIFAMSWLLLGFLRSPQLAQATGGDVRPILESVPVLIVGGAFLGILLTSFGVLLQALYLAGDMDFLLSTPLPIRAVFLAKLLQAILPNFSLICVFALPILYGLGAAGGYNLLYYPLVLVVLAALALAAAGISSLLVMAIVRIFPARRVAEVLGFVGAIMSFICSQSGQLARFDNISTSQTSQALNLVSRLNNPWSPLAWAGRGLLDLGEGRWLAAAGFLSLTLALAALVFGVALTTAERLYYTGWASIQNNRRKKKVSKASRQAIRPAVQAEGNDRAQPVPGGLRLPSAVRAILWKDYYVLQRDLRNMSQLVTPLIFGLVYTVMFVRGGGQPPAGRGEAPPLFMAALNNLWVYGNVAISLFVGWMLVARLAGMGFSQEGRSYWLVKTAPVRPAQLVGAKFIIAYVPALVLGWLFLLGISLVQHANLGILLFTLPVVGLCIAGNTGLNLAFGVTGAKMDWEDPRQMQRGTSGCLAMVVSLVYLPLSLGLFFVPSLVVTLVSWPEIAGQAAGLLLGGVFSLACAIVPLWLVRDRIPRLGEA